MKFGVLRSIGHNIADSLASGVGLMVGEYEFDVFQEANSSLAGYLEVDFLNGTTSGSRPSPTLARVIAKYHAALPGLCRRHGANASDFRCLTSRYVASGLSVSFTVTVEDQQGCRAEDFYDGVPGQHPRVLDALGRIRRTRRPVVRINTAEQAE